MEIGKREEHVSVRGKWIPISEVWIKDWKNEYDYVGFVYKGQEWRSKVIIREREEE